MSVLFCKDESKRQNLFFLTIIILFTSVPVFQGYFIRYADTFLTEIIYLLCNIITVFVSFFCFERIFNNNIIGATCCALYTLSIYRLGRLIVFKNINELIAMIFIPLIVYGLYEVSVWEKSKKNIVLPAIPLSIGYTGLIISDFPTFEIAIMVTVIVCVFVMLTRKKFGQFIIAAGAVFTGILLWGWSAISKIKDVSAFDTIQSRGLYLSGLLIQFWKIEINVPENNSAINYYAPVGLGIIPFIGLAVFLFLWFAGRFMPAHNDSDSYMCSMSIASVILIWMSLRSFPWDRIQTAGEVAGRMIGMFENPERFVGMATICMVMVIGYILLFFQKKCQMYKQLYCVGIIVVLLGVVTSGLYLIDEGNRSADYYNTIAMNGGIGVSEYVEE